MGNVTYNLVDKEGQVVYTAHGQYDETGKPDGKIDSDEYKRAYSSIADNIKKAEAEGEILGGAVGESYVEFSELDGDASVSNTKISAYEKLSQGLDWRTSVMGLFRFNSTHEQSVNGNVITVEPIPDAGTTSPDAAPSNPVSEVKSAPAGSTGGSLSRVAEPKPALSSAGDDKLKKIVEKIKKDLEGKGFSLPYLDPKCVLKVKEYLKAEGTSEDKIKEFEATFKLLASKVGNDGRLTKKIVDSIGGKEEKREKFLIQVAQLAQSAHDWFKAAKASPVSDTEIEGALKGVEKGKQDKIYPLPSFSDSDYKDLTKVLQNSWPAANYTQFKTVVDAIGKGIGKGGNNDLTDAIVEDVVTAVAKKKGLSVKREDVVKMIGQAIGTVRWWVGVKKKS